MLDRILSFIAEKIASIAIIRRDSSIQLANPSIMTIDGCAINQIRLASGNDEIYLSGLIRIKLSTNRSANTPAWRIVIDGQAYKPRYYCAKFWIDGGDNLLRPVWQFSGDDSYFINPLALQANQKGSWMFSGTFVKA